MIHVCSLARLYATVDETGARHIVTLLKVPDRVERPAHIEPDNHLVLTIDDISMPMDGYTCPADEHVAQLIAFVGKWDRAAPMVMHCFAGISRSTAGAYVAACALNPERDEMQIAWDIRRAPRSPMPASSRSPTACSSATAAWCARSTPSAPASARWKAIRSGWRLPELDGRRRGYSARPLQPRQLPIGPAVQPRP